MSEIGQVFYLKKVHFEILTQRLSAAAFLRSDIRKPKRVFFSNSRNFDLIFYNKNYELFKSNFSLFQLIKNF